MSGFHAVGQYFKVRSDKCMCKNHKVAHFLELIASVLALDNDNGVVLIKQAYLFPTDNKTLLRCCLKRETVTIIIH